ncbi:MAG: DNA-binding protein WhiA [Firmicutes bacterium]|nr:DNA-binding protein WhiA [Bacillota bacterium]
MNITEEVVFEIDGSIDSRCCRETVNNGERAAAECCKQALLIHCFLIGGLLLIHEKGGYSLEFYVGELKDIFKRVLDEFGFKAGENKGGVYIKDRDSICDILAMMGANKAVLKLNDLIATREYSQTISRKANCDIANVDRTVEVSLKQCEVVERLMRSGIIEDEKLLEVAIVRLNFREASYEELADKLGISKSSIRYRLDKLMKMSGQIGDY